MKPIIGISSFVEYDGDEYSVSMANAHALLQAGGMTVMLPHLEKKTDIDEMAQFLDGLYLTGGYDIDPTLFGEEPHPHLGVVDPARDIFELALVRKFLTLNKPILGVCRGCQSINIAIGGDVYQDIGAQIKEDYLQHQQRAPKSHGSHYVDVTIGSLLHQVTGQKRLKVNSRHHQANRNVPFPLRVSGSASDGVIEAIESEVHSFVLGVQWHPENMFFGGDEASRKIFSAFIEACNKNQNPQ